MKKLLSLIVSLILCITCALAFVGCGKKSDEVRQEPVVDNSKVVVELLPVDELLQKNSTDISIYDVKTQNGNILPLLFKDVTIGNLLKTVLEKNAQDDKPMIAINLYKDGFWKCGPNMIKVDSDLNTILNYELFSGELDITPERLGLVGDKKIVDLVCSSFFNVDFSIENAISGIESNGAEQVKPETSGVLSMNSNPMEALVKSVAQNRGLFELVKPVLLLSINDFYNITVTDGASLFATYLEMDIDYYISAAISLAGGQVNGGSLVGLETLLCRLLDGTLSEPLFNNEVKACVVVEDIIEILGGRDANAACKLLAKVSSYLDPDCTLGDVRFLDLQFNTVEELVSEVDSYLGILGLEQFSTFANTLINNVFYVNENGLSVNTQQKISVIVDALLPQNEQLATQIKDIFGEKTIGDLLNPMAKAEVETMLDGLKNVAGSITTNRQIVEMFNGMIDIAKKYIAETDGVAIFDENQKIADFINDFAKVVNNVLRLIPDSAVSSEAIKVMFDAYAGLFGEYAIKDMYDAALHIDIENLLNVITVSVKAAVNEKSALSKMVDFLIFVFKGNLENPTLNTEFFGKTVGDIAYDYFGGTIAETKLISDFSNVTVSELVAFVQGTESESITAAMQSAKISDLLDFVNSIESPIVSDAEVIALASSSTLVVTTVVYVVVVSIVESFVETMRVANVRNAYTSFLVDNISKTGITDSAVLVYVEDTAQSVDSPLVGKLYTYDGASTTIISKDISNVTVKELGEEIELEVAYKVNDRVYIIFYNDIVE